MGIGKSEAVFAGFGNLQSHIEKLLKTIPSPVRQWYNPVYDPNLHPLRRSSRRCYASVLLTCPGLRLTPLIQSRPHRFGIFYSPRYLLLSVLYSLPRLV